MDLVTSLCTSCYLPFPLTSLTTCLVNFFAFDFLRSLESIHHREVDRKEGTAERERPVGCLLNLHLWTLLNEVDFEEKQNLDIWKAVIEPRDSACNVSNTDCIKMSISGLQNIFDGWTILRPSSYDLDFGVWVQIHVIQNGMHDCLSAGWQRLEHGNIFDGWTILRPSS